VAKGVGCSTCHGAVETMKLMRQAAPLTMQWCLDCHRDPAPNLRPREAVFDQSWAPPKDQAARGAALAAAYHVAQPARLSECSLCHR
jgi:NAD-dependent SIR2 family protein deacetylase